MEKVQTWNVFTEVADGFTRKDWMGGAYAQLFVLVFPLTRSLVVLWINQSQLIHGCDVVSPCCDVSVSSDWFIWDNASFICARPTRCGPRLSRYRCQKQSTNLITITFMSKLVRIIT